MTPEHELIETAREQAGIRERDGMVVTADILTGLADLADRLVARAEAAEGREAALREALRQAHVWITDAIEEQGATDDELLALPGTMWARILSAREALGGGS